MKRVENKKASGIKPVSEIIFDFTKFGEWLYK
jgi:hypothetical protein